MKNDIKSIMSFDSKGSNYFLKAKLVFRRFTFYTRRKIVEVILLNFRSNLGHMDKLEVI